ncbi:MAG: hypothetical protein ACJ71W_20090 [Terriglobales bacterium]
MLVVGWLLWGLDVVLLVGFVRGMRSDARQQEPIHIITMTQATAFLVLAILFLVISWSKLQLLWLIPTAWIGSFLGFGFYRIPILGTAIRVLILAFGRFALVGVGGNIRGVPYGK